MQKIVGLVCCFLMAGLMSMPVLAQKKAEISQELVSNTLKTLSADDMEGRKIFSPGLDKAANFIAENFKRTGLEFYPGLTSYKQNFGTTKTKFISAEGTVNNTEIKSRNIIALTNLPELRVSEQSKWETAALSVDKDFMQQAASLAASGRKLIVQVPLLFEKKFSGVKRIRSKDASAEQNIIFILTDEILTTYNIHFVQEVQSLPMANVIGILPGKTKPGEYVVFSGHYDHLGIGKPDASGDSIYNGANDDASGVTAVIALANYYKLLDNNERSIIFIAFTGEETGGFGSGYFSTHINPDSVIAMGNIEMIGTHSKWGEKSVYVTGAERSDMMNIIQKEISETELTFHADPYPDQQLFYRSDNATLAALGVPAHTISTAQMDQDKTYHTPGDEFETLEMNNMTNLIRGIGKSFASIISGKATPQRVTKPTRD